jgi:hypothetical protein
MHRCSQTDIFYTRIEWFPVRVRQRLAVKRPVIQNVTSGVDLSPSTLSSD